MCTRTHLNGRRCKNGLTFDGTACCCGVLGSLKVMEKGKGVTEFHVTPPCAVRTQNAYTWLHTKHTLLHWMRCPAAFCHCLQLKQASSSR